MNAQLLIDAVVRQVTVLVAQLATSGGARAPLAHIANQVFVDLANELDSQGVSRKVGADMFGMALRAYVRKVRRLEEARSEAGVTLWQAVLAFIRGEEMAGRAQILKRFEHDGELQVSSILHDLTESGLVFSSGSGANVFYRAASEHELGRLAQLMSEAGLDEFVLVVVHRLGACSAEEIDEQLGRPLAGLSQVLDRLVVSGRLKRTADGRFQAEHASVPFGATLGWEAAVIDHLQAVVRTICQRLQTASLSADNHDVIGGSTYTYDVWPGHPLQAEVLAQLQQFRVQSGKLRERVDAYNRRSGLAAKHQQVVSYAGQCIFERELDATDVHSYSNNDDENKSQESTQP